MIRGNFIDGYETTKNVLKTNNNLSHHTFTLMRVPGFEPEARAWQARVLPGYTTPASNPYS